MLIVHSQDDESESESLSLSSGSSTQSIYSQEVSNSLHQTKHPSRTNVNSSRSRRNSHHHRPQGQTIHYELHSMVFSGLLIAGILIALLLGVISHLYTQLNLESMKTNETMLSSQTGISESSFRKPTDTKANSDGELPYALLKGSKQSIADNFVVVLPEEVKCQGSMTFFSLQIRMFWESCMDPKQLFSNKLLQAKFLNLNLKRTWHILYQERTDGREMRTRALWDLTPSRPSVEVPVTTSPWEGPTRSFSAEETLLR